MKGLRSRIVCNLWQSSVRRHTLQQQKFLEIAGAPKTRLPVGVYATISGSRSNRLARIGQRNPSGGLNVGGKIQDNFPALQRKGGPTRSKFRSIESGMVGVIKPRTMTELNIWDTVGFSDSGRAKIANQPAPAGSSFDHGIGNVGTWFVVPNDKSNNRLVEEYPVSLWFTAELGLGHFHV